jgi:hypothetical protein
MSIGPVQLECAKHFVHLLRALRASVGSTDASASLPARVGVVGPKRLTEAKGGSVPRPERAPAQRDAIEAPAKSALERVWRGRWLRRTWSAPRCVR